MKFKAFLSLIVLLLVCGSLQAQTIKATNIDGGSVKTKLSYGIEVNKNSSLHRAWINLNDSNCPVQLSDAGIVTEYRGEDYRFRPSGSITATEPISAFDITFILYDVFGEHVKTLKAVTVEDIPENKPYSLKEAGAWRAWENEISELLTIVCFVSQVRTASGKIWQSNEKALTDELNKVRLQVTTGIFEMKKEK